MNERYRLYREHKFLRSSLSDLENRIARTDFTDQKQAMEIQSKLEEILNVMEYHAKHENVVIHPLLGDKGSHLIDSIETDHKNYASVFEDLKTKIAKIVEMTNEVELVRKGYEFYIAFRQFLAVDLQHINQEETVIMPELQKYYSDEELKKKIDFPVYAQMSSDDMVEMMSVLFPHMNLNDKEHFLSDLQESQPEKFSHVWQGIAPTIHFNEREVLMKKLNLGEIPITV